MRIVVSGTVVVVVAALLSGCGVVVHTGSGPVPRATATVTKTIDPVLGDPDPGSIGSNATPDLVTLRTKGFEIGLPYRTRHDVEHFTLGGQYTTYVVYESGDGTNGYLLTARVRYPHGYVADPERALRGSAATDHLSVKDDRATTFHGYPARTGRYHGKVKGHQVTAFVLMVDVDHDLFECKYYLQSADRVRPPALFKQVLDTIVLRKGVEDGTQSS